MRKSGIWSDAEVKPCVMPPAHKIVEKALNLLTFMATPCIMTEFYGDIKYQA